MQVMEHYAVGCICGLFEPDGWGLGHHPRLPGHGRANTAKSGLEGTGSAQ
jgi:hypothetical protein